MRHIVNTWLQTQLGSDKLESLFANLIAGYLPAVFHAQWQGSLQWKWHIEAPRTSTTENEHLNSIIMAPPTRKMATFTWFKRDRGPAIPGAASNPCLAPI